nr:hypothetical protein CFP56_36281 [Quercus suber]
MVDHIIFLSVLTHIAAEEQVYGRYVISTGCFIAIAIIMRLLARCLDSLGWRYSLSRSVETEVNLRMVTLPAPRSHVHRPKDAAVLVHSKQSLKVAQKL